MMIIIHAVVYLYIILVEYLFPNSKIALSLVTFKHWFSKQNGAGKPLLCILHFLSIFKLMLPLLRPDLSALCSLCYTICHSLSQGSLLVQQPANIFVSFPDLPSASLQLSDTKTAKLFAECQTEL